MTRSARNVVLGLVLCTCGCVLLYLYTLSGGNRLSVPDLVPFLSRKIGGFVGIGYNRSVSGTQQGRIAHIQEVCNNTSLWKNTTYKGRDSTKFYYSKEYDFAYCKVPKSGSTFWTRIFSILKHGSTYYDTAFGTKRSTIHKHSNAYRVPYGVAKKRRVVLVSRDPYSRLYSAYVDKCFIPLANYANKRILNHQTGKKTGSTCKTSEVTFQQFLDFVTDRSFTGHSLNRHWAPIFSLCRPCDVNQFVLVKQESFSDDVEHVLRELGVEHDKVETIRRALHDHRVNATIPGIVQTMMYIVRRRSTIIKCLGWEAIARRIWKSLQIQGYIRASIQFPFERLKTSPYYGNDWLFVGVILDTIAAHPMTPAESKEHRRIELVNAYKDIRRETVRAIQEVYREDFEIYGYDINPPK